MIYLRYLWYILRHKWYVFVECCKLGIPWLGIIHDWTRFYPGEFFPRARFLYGGEAVRDETGYYSPSAPGNEAYYFSWFLHQKRSRHHWQWWILPKDNGGTMIFPMSSRYRREMLADMRGAGRAQGKPDIVNFYRANADKMQLHPETREWLELQLGLTGPVT